MTSDELKLKDLAEALPPDPWAVGGERLSYQENKMMYSVFGPRSVGDWEDWGYTKDSADYIAAANPAAILSLLERIEALEQDAARYRALRSGSHDDHIFIAIDSGAPGEPPFSISGEWADKEVDALIAQQDKGKETV